MSEARNSAKWLEVAYNRLKERMVCTVDGCGDPDIVFADKYQFFSFVKTLKLWVTYAF